MKTITVRLLHSVHTYNIVERKLPFRLAVIGMPHTMTAFAYLSNTYRDDIDRLKDCNSYKVFPSLKQVVEFIIDPYGHKGYEAAEALTNELVRWGVLEEVEDD